MNIKRGIQQISRLFTLFPLAVLMTPLPCMGWEYGGNLSLRGVNYLKDRGLERRNEQATAHLDLKVRQDFGDAFTLMIRPEIYYEITEPRIRRFEPLEGYLEYRADTWDIRIGQVLESWAITDTFNPADILNRRDLERGLLQAPKLGEMMLRYRYFLPDRAGLYNQMVNVYVLPLFRRLRFPKKDDPYSFEPPGVTVKDQDGIQPGGVHQMGFAARYGASFQDVDFFLLGYHGVTRNPVFQIEAENTLLRPVSYLVDKAGGGLQWAWDDWLWKLEFVRTWPHRENLGPRLMPATLLPGPYTQFVAGFDRSFYSVGLANSTLTLTLEYSGEDRTANAPGEFRPFKSDVFAGLRYEFGAVTRAVLSASFAYDVLIGESIADAAFAWKPFRGNENLKVILAGEYQRAAENAANSFLRFFPDNSHISLKTEWSF